MQYLYKRILLKDVAGILAQNANWMRIAAQINLGFLFTCLVNGQIDPKHAQLNIF